MRNYYKIATIFVRGIALSFLMTAMTDLGLIAINFVFMKTGVFYRDEIAFRSRLMFAAFDIIAAAFLYFKSDLMVGYIVKGFDNELDEDEIDDINQENSNQSNLSNP